MTTVIKIGAPKKMELHALSAVSDSDLTTCHRKHNFLRHDVMQRPAMKHFEENFEVVYGRESGPNESAKQNAIQDCRSRFASIVRQLQRFLIR